MTSASHSDAACYAATFTSMIGLVVPAAALTALGIAVNVTHFVRGDESSAPFAALCAVPLLFVLLLRLRLRVAIGPDRIVYRGVLGEQEVSVSSVQAAGWAAEGAESSPRPPGAFRVRFVYGPLVYQLSTGDAIMRINLKLFPKACGAHLLAIVPPR